jgi:hypothetical protein
MGEQEENRTLVTFEDLERELLARGFRAISDVQFVSEFRRLGLIAPRPRIGREAGFTFSRNGLVVRVWTTWLRREKILRDVDAGWVLITKGDSALYFSHPLNRTKNFFLNLFRQAWIAKFRVQNRPHCPDCNAFMEIVRGPELKERYWRCDRVERHGDRTARSYRWDIGLPEKAQAYIDGLRRERMRHEEKIIIAGGKPHAAMLKRKPWKRHRNGMR